MSNKSDYLIRVLIEIHIFNDKQCRSRSVGFFRQGMSCLARERLRDLNTLGELSVIFDKSDNFLFAFLKTKFRLKKNVLLFFS